MQESKNKLTWLLILQGWTMLWVVIGHAPLNAPGVDAPLIDEMGHELAQAFFSFAYSFHMPLFIMISGYLFYRTRIDKGWKYLDMVKEKLLRLGIPYMVFITIAIVIKICLPGNVDRQVDISPLGLIMNYISPFNGALQEMWFVAVIFVYFLMYPIYPYLLKNKWSILLTILTAALLFLIPVNSMPNVFALNWAVHFFIFFFIGIVISCKNLDSLISSWKSIVVSLMLYIIGWFIETSVLRPLSASIAFWGLAVAVDKSLTDGIFKSFRNYTYQVFLIGIFVQILVKILYEKFLFPGSYFVWYFLCIILGVYIPVVMTKIVERMENKYINRIFGL